MGWLHKLFRVTPRQELDGVSFDTDEPFWELDGRTNFPRLFRALADLLPDDCILYFEGGSPRSMMQDFFRTHSIPEQTHVAVATLWPRPTCYHIPATAQNLAHLADLTESCGEWEVAVHFHIYRSGRVLLEWHDIFANPMLLDGRVPAAKVKTFAEALKKNVARRGDPAGPGKGSPVNAP